MDKVLKLLVLEQVPPFLVAERFPPQAAGPRAVRLRGTRQERLRSVFYSWARQRSPKQGA